MSTYQEIQDRIKELQKQAEEAKRNECKEQINKIKAIMAAYDISIDMIAKTSANKLPSKAKPKYRNPVSGETWSGRGKMPLWMKSEVTKNNKQKEDFLIA